jgi:hypothetical protein
MAMKMVYIPETPFGDFFYDPLSLKGVAINKDGRCCILGMKEDYDPTQFPGYKECEVGDIVFAQLKYSALIYSSALENLQAALRHFPRGDEPIFSPRKAASPLE